MTDDAIDARVDERRLAWTTVHGTELTFDGRGAAAEARLCLTDDRCPVDEVASLAGVVPVRRSVRVSEVSTDGAAALLAARPGAVVGPWAVGSQWRILLVTGRVAPDPSAPEVRQRARTELADEVILRLAARVVVADGIN